VCSILEGLADIWGSLKDDGGGRRRREKELRDRFVTIVYTIYFGERGACMLLLWLFFGKWRK
jgi:hypothetical protein